MKKIIIIVITLLLLLSCKERMYEGESDFDVYKTTYSDVFQSDMNYYDTVSEDIVDLWDAGYDTVNDTVEDYTGDYTDYSIDSEDVSEIQEIRCDSVIYDDISNYCSYDGGSEDVENNITRFYESNNFIRYYAISKDSRVIVLVERAGNRLVPVHKNHLDLPNWDVFRLVWITTDGVILNENYFEGISTSYPVISDDNYVYFMKSNGYLSKYDIFGNPVESVKLYDMIGTPETIDIYFPLIVDKDEVYTIVSEIGKDYNILTKVKNDKIEWQKRLPLEGYTDCEWSLLMGPDRNLYCYNSKGEVISISSEDGEERWRVSIDKDYLIWGIIPDWDNNIYVAGYKRTEGDNELGVIAKIRDGKVEWRNYINREFYQFGDVFTILPDNRIVVISDIVSGYSTDVHAYIVSNCGEKLREKWLHSGMTSYEYVVLSDGGILLNDYYDGKYRVIRFDSDLNFEVIADDTVGMRANGCESVFFESREGLFTYKLRELGVAKVPWPMLRGDAQNTGRVQKW